MVTIGIDTHKATLASCAVDELGRELAASTFANDPSWPPPAACAGPVLQGPDRQVRDRGLGKLRRSARPWLFVAAGEMVVEVPATLTDRERRHLRRRGKSDPADALAIARVVLREPTPPPGDAGAHRR